jgi:hypothetical protein
VVEQQAPQQTSLTLCLLEQAVDSVRALSSSRTWHDLWCVGVWWSCQGGGRQAGKVKPFVLIKLVDDGHVAPLLLCMHHACHCPLRSACNIMVMLRPFSFAFCVPLSPSFCLTDLLHVPPFPQLTLPYHSEETKPASKAGKHKKPAPAAAGGPAKLTRAHGPAEEPFDEETELRAIALNQQLMELSNIRRLQLGQDRFGNIYWLLGTSQLPVATDCCPSSGLVGGSGAEAAAGGGDEQEDQELAAAAAGRKAGKGAAKGGGSSRTGAMGTYGCVFVQAPQEQLLPSKASTAHPTAAAAYKPGLPPPAPMNAAAAAALAAAAPSSSGSGAAAVAAAGGAAALGPLRDVATAAESAAAAVAVADSGLQQQLLLLPALSEAAAATATAAGVSSSRKAAAGSSGQAGGVLRTHHAAAEAVEQQPWGVFSSLAQIDAVLEWLNPQGIREGPLKVALQRVRDNMVLFAPSPTDQAAAAAAAVEGDGQQQEQQTYSSRAGTPSVTAAAPAAGASKQQAAPSRLQHNSSNDQQQQQQQLEPAAVAALQQQLVAAAAADDDAAAADALRDGLSRFMMGLPEASMHSFWGSSGRCEAWQGALAVARQPADFAALIAQLELMLLTDSWRMGWQLWAQPAQNPTLVQTWPQVCLGVPLFVSFRFRGWGLFLFVFGVWGWGGR